MKLPKAAGLALLISFVMTGQVRAAENPMDEFGLLHNHYLACLHEAGANIANSLEILIDKCDLDPGMPRDEFIAHAQPIIETNPLLPLVERLAPYRKEYSEYEFSFYLRIDDVVRTARSMEEAGAVFAELEREGIERLDVKSAGGQKVLAALSTIRHSHAYWTAYAARGDGGPRKRKWWHWVVIVVADGAGAVAGSPGLVSAIGTAAAASGAADELVQVIDSD